MAAASVHVLPSLADAAASEPPISLSSDTVLQDRIGAEVREGVRTSTAHQHTPSTRHYSSWARHYSAWVPLHRVRRLRWTSWRD